MAMEFRLLVGNAGRRHKWEEGWLRGTHYSYSSDISVTSEVPTQPEEVHHG